MAVTEFSPGKRKFDKVYQNGSNGGVSAKQFKNNECQEKQIDETTLPICAAKDQIVAEIRKHSITILISETGSGKTTQIPQYMTDGMMLREAIHDPLLRKFSYVILDEAHERTLHTDVMFGVVKRAQILRRQKFAPELKIIVMSATMDVDHFAVYFNNAPVVYVEGRQHPIQIMYAAENITDYFHSTLVAIFQLHLQEPVDKDFLVFLTGQEEIEAAVRKCKEIVKELPPDCPKINVLPLYSALKHQSQMKVFEPSKKGVRKVIISTNVAETSLTIPGVRIVIDSGKVKSRIYDPTKGIDMLKVVSISKAQACQRAGRSGREGPGLCYRLYKEQDYDEKFLDVTPPEILRCNLSSAILEMFAMGIRDIGQFDFMDKPKSEAIAASVRELKLLKAIEETNDKNLELTNLGKKMSAFPLDPKLSRIILAAEKLSSTEEALTVVALMSSENILVTTVSSKKEECQAAHHKFFAPEGDLISLLKIYRAYHSVPNGGKYNWCQENFIHFGHMATVEKVRSQLRDVCLNQKISLSSCGVNYDQLRKAICFGMFLNAAELDTDGRYRTVDSGINAVIHPSSCLFQHKPSFVVYLDLSLTDKLYLRDVTVVDPRWLIEAAPDYFRSKHLKCT